MQSYTYTMDATCPVLNDIIKLNDVLRPLVVNIMVNMNMDGSVPMDNVMIYTSAVLDSTQEDILISIINGYSAHPLKARKMIEDTVMSPAMTFGKEFLRMFSANNVYLGKTTAQTNALLATYPNLIDACLTGSLISLYETMLAMVPDSNVSQEEIDEFTKRVAIYLGVV